MAPDEIAKFITEDIRVNNGLIFEDKSNDVFYGALVDVILGYEPGYYSKLKRNWSKAYQAALNKQISDEEYADVDYRFRAANQSDHVEFKSGYSNSICIMLKGDVSRNDAKTTVIWAWPGKFEYKAYLDKSGGVGFNGVIKYPFTWDDIHMSIKNGFEKMKAEIYSKIDRERPKDVTMLGIGGSTEEEDPADWWKHGGEPKPEI